MLDIQECAPMMPIDSNTGSKAQWMAQSREVVVPNMSIFLKAFIIYSKCNCVAKIRKKSAFCIFEV